MARISAACRCRCAKASLSRLLARRVDGIFLRDFEQREIGPDLFRHACRMGWRDWSANTARAVTEAAGLVEIPIGGIAIAERDLSTDDRSGSRKLIHLY